MTTPRFPMVADATAGKGSVSRELDFCENASRRRGSRGARLSRGHYTSVVCASCVLGCRAEKVAQNYHRWGSGTITSLRHPLHGRGSRAPFVRFPGKLWHHPCAPPLRAARGYRVGTAWGPWSGLGGAANIDMDAIRSPSQEKESEVAMPFCEGAASYDRRLELPFVVVRRTCP